MTTFFASRLARLLSAPRHAIDTSALLAHRLAHRYMPGPRTLALLLAGSLCACASGPVPRDWQINARDAMETAVEMYLSGNDRLADTEFARAREAIASTGKLDLLARITLTLCAAQVASLVDIKTSPEASTRICPAFDALAADARPEEKTYSEYLNGRWQGINPALLPSQYRSVISNGQDSKTLANMADPISRLIAASVLLQRGQLAPEGIAIAVDTASSQGWRRPLLAWLGVQLQRAEATGNASLAEQAKKRIALVNGQSNDRPNGQP